MVLYPHTHYRKIIFFFSKKERKMLWLFCHFYLVYKTSKNSKCFLKWNIPDGFKYAKCLKIKGLGEICFSVTVKFTVIKSQLKCRWLNN